jgi:bacillopeptidase F (M6 metalloprotease family)
MTRPVDLSDASTAALTLKARYEIEAGFDYLYVQASTDGGTTWTSLDGTAGGEPFVRTASDQPAISGSSDGEWVDVNVPLDAYAGQAIELRFLYDTDGGVAPDGFFADEVSVVAGEAPVFTSGATLHVNGRASFIRGQNAQPVFDDSRPYWFPENPQTGVKVPDTGTRIRVASVDGTSMRIRVNSS